MKKLFLFTAILLVCGTVLLPLYLTATIPDKVQETLLRGLLEVGFDKVMAEAVEQNHGTVILKNIKIGDGGFSSINEVRAEYSWLGVLLKRRIDNLQITGMQLTGEINDDNSLTLAGWTRPKELHKTSLTYTDIITIDKAEIDLLSPVGGINLNLNGQIRRKAPYGLTFQGNVEGAQRQLSVSAQATGEIAANGNWQARIEIEQGKLDLGPVRAGRMSGLSQIYGQGNALKKATTQLSAGAMTIYELPWQNASMAIEGRPGDFKVFLEGKSIGEEGIELGINFDYTNKIENLEGIVHTQNISELFKYLQQHRLVPSDFNPPALLHHIPNLTFTLNQTGSSQDQDKTKTLSYALKDEQQVLDLKGNLKVNPEDKTLAGTLSVSPILLERLVKNPDETAKNGFRGGVVSVSGDFISEIEDNHLKTDGKVAAKLEDARYFIAPVFFEKINGDIVFDDLKTWSLSKPVSLSFKLPLKEKVTHQGTANLQTKPDSNRLMLKSAALEIFGGFIESGAIELSESLEEQNINLKLNNVDMGQATLALDIDRLHITGSLSGALPLEYRDGKLHIKNGRLSSKAGNLRYRSENPPPFLQNEDIHTETMRMALENYRFTNLNVQLNGPVDGDLALSVSAKGTNPELFEGRAMTLNFSLVIKAGSLLKKIAR